MSTLKKKITTTKEKLVGEAKETIGKAIDDKELELEGKLQTAKADYIKKVDSIKESAKKDIKDMAEGLKDSTLEKINEKIDSMKDK